MQRLGHGFWLPRQTPRRPAQQLPCAVHLCANLTHVPALIVIDSMAAVVRVRAWWYCTCTGSRRERAMHGSRWGVEHLHPFPTRLRYSACFADITSIRVLHVVCEQQKVLCQGPRRPSVGTSASWTAGTQVRVYFRSSRFVVPRSLVMENGQGFEKGKKKTVCKGESVSRPLLTLVTVIPSESSVDCAILECTLKWFGPRYPGHRLCLSMRVSSVVDTGCIGMCVLAWPSGVGHLFLSSTPGAQRPSK